MHQKRQNSSKSRTKFSPIANSPSSPETSPLISSQVLAMRTLETRKGLPAEKRTSNPTVSSMSSPSDSISSSEVTHTRKEGSERSRAILRQSIEKLTEELIHSVGLEPVAAKENMKEVVIVKGKSLQLIQNSL